MAVEEDFVQRAGAQNDECWNQKILAVEGERDESMAFRKVNRPFTYQAQTTAKIGLLTKPLIHCD